MNASLKLAAAVAIGAIVSVSIGCSQPSQQPPSMSSTATAQAPATVATTTPPAATSAEHPGKAVYDRACAMCHNNPEGTRSPALDALKQMRFTNVHYALTEGKMKLQAAGLSADEKKAVTDFLAGGGGGATDDWVAKMMCSADRSKVDLTKPATVTGFGFDNQNHRYLSKAQAGLATSDFANLELAWSMAFPKATTMRSQPAVVGSTLFFPVGETSQLLAIDASTAQPCLKWVYNSELPLRTSAAYGDVNGRKVIAVGDVAANIHLVDASTGAKLWQQSVQLFPLSITTGTPVIHEGRVYAPVSQYEITLGGNDDHECCKTHGAVVALDGQSGKKIWTAHTMEDAKPVRDRGDGKMLWGPSGAPIWNSPALDAKRGLLYVGTGEATSEPAAKTTDAILALDLKDGALKWAFQATENDIFLTGCSGNRPAPSAAAPTTPARRQGLNCPRESVFRDVDFGASVIIGKGANGADLLFAGQKSGTLWALHADTGKVAWRQDFGEGSPLGGIHWGIAYDGERVFAPINRPYGFGPAGSAPRTQKPGIHAVDAKSGNVLWTFAAEPDCTGDRQTRVRSCSSNIGLSGAPTVIDGALIAGSLDGFVRVFDAKTGEVLFKFDTATSFDTLNGVPGKGGSVDNASIVATNGTLFVASGYGMFGQPPGNVLLAFRPKGK
jgi:polyvinyl alcohol dehydrogenase (cytochrome)